MKLVVTLSLVFAVATAMLVVALVVSIKTRCPVFEGFAATPNASSTAASNASTNSAVATTNTTSNTSTNATTTTTSNSKTGVTKEELVNALTQGANDTKKKIDDLDKKVQDDIVTSKNDTASWAVTVFN